MWSRERQGVTDRIQCGKPAAVVYVWPTMEHIPVCEDCATKMRGIAAVMGFRIGTLEPREGQTCAQYVKDTECLVRAHTERREARDRTTDMRRDE